jgi:hypothetical protein
LHVDDEVRVDREQRLLAVSVAGVGALAYASTSSRIANRSAACAGEIEA